MRILHLLSQTELTGAEVYAQQLMEFQKAAGDQVFLISDRFHVPSPVELKSMSISTTSFWQRMQNILELRKFFAENQIQVVHCHSRGAARHAYWAKIGMPVAQVTTLHGRQHFSWSKRLVNIYGELMIAICENVKLAHQRNFKTPASLFRTIRNPIDLKPTPRATPPIPKLALLGRSSGPKGKRIEEIGFHCFEIWLKTIPNLEISIIAPRPENFSKAFVTFIAQLNAKSSGKIQLLGQVDHLATRLKDYSLNICSGRIAMESLIAGTPVLACGEWNSVGVVSEKNWREALASNFGDIGAGELTEEKLDLQKITRDVTEFFQSSSLVTDLSAKCAEEFSIEKVSHQVRETYKAAIFKRHVRHWIPALMYHRIPDQALDTVHRIFVTKENFEKHLRFFTRRKMTALGFRDLLSFWNLEKPYSEFPKKPLLLTFDDGYLDNLTNLQPLLLKYKMKATIFLLADHSIVENTWDADTGEKPAPLMTLTEKKKLSPEAFEIGSHGFHHLHLNQVSDLVALNEMKNSREALEKDFGQAPVAFAYPFGDTNEILPELCEKAGYHFAVNTDQGGLHLADQPFSIFRVNIFPEDNTWSLRKKTAPWYRNYFFSKRRR